jgi:hypothetical protein
VTVVVDYGPLGGGTQIGCDPSGAGKPASQVAPTAGFPLAFVNGEGFVCRIAGKPDSSKESCQRTPPADAYWALFWSDGKSSTWMYATIGVGGLSVPEGGSIGWRFEDGGARENPGQPPTMSPDEPSPSPSPHPQPTGAPKPSAAPQPSRTATPSASSPPASTPSGASAPSPPRSDGPAAAAPTPDGTGGGHGGNGKPSDSTAPPHRAGDGQQRVRSQTAGQQVTASGDTTDEAVSASGQKVLTAIAASSVVLLGAAVGVAGWRRRS